MKKLGVVYELTFPAEYRSGNLRLGTSPIVVMHFSLWRGEDRIIYSLDALACPGRDRVFLCDTHHA